MSLRQIDQNGVVLLLWRCNFYFVKLVPFLLTALLEQALGDPGDVVLWLDGVLADNGNKPGNIVSRICSRMYIYLYRSWTRPCASACTILRGKSAVQLTFDFE